MNCRSLHWAVFGLAVLTAGCASTKPLEGAAIEYRMPRTDAAVAATFSISDCTAGKFVIKVEAELSAKPGANLSTLYKLDGSALRSHRIKRSLGVSVSEDGVLTGINSSSSDQTAGIVANGLKVLAAVFPLVLGAKPGEATNNRPETDCTQVLPNVPVALRRLNSLKSQMSDLNEALADPSVPATVAAQKIKLLNKLAQEYVNVQGWLKVVTTAKMKLDCAPIAGCALTEAKLDAAPFRKWFAAGLDDTALESMVRNYFGLDWQAATVTQSSVPALRETGGHSGRFERNCGLAIFVPRMSVAHVSLQSFGIALGGVKVPGDPLAQTDLPLAQWLPAAELCIDVGFGESRDVALKFDKFGRVNDFQWSSEASGANIAAAAAGSLGDVSTIYKSIKGPSALEKAKQELDELDTQQKLAKLKACQAILDAGGSSCEEKKSE